MSLLSLYRYVRHLYLSENRLTSLPQKLLGGMPQLENLFLHGNPWTCDCRMKWFPDWDKNSPGYVFYLPATQ